MIPPRFPIYLAGPTGSGKTAVAMELAGKLGSVEIINADAFQIYRGMEILSAAPTEEERAAIPHHLFGIFDPTLPCDAAQFAEKARDTIAEVSRRSIPLVVGGSGLYLKAITHGLAPTPPGDPVLRAELEEDSLEELVARYEKLDPEGAAQTNLKNRRYVTRNLEICLLAGEPASKLKSAWQENSPDLCAFFLKRKREDLYERINQRTPLMFNAGVVKEVAQLNSLSTTAEKAIGVEEIRGLLSGEIEETACIEAIRQSTRRYAKRQESWFKREASFHPVSIDPGEDPATIADRILPLVQSFDPEG
ncbi:MAG: tRNA (adenosine(37)-N6)-dimethylallyltransferase MiaA [Verrucomicrobiota bacterium]